MHQAAVLIALLTAAQAPLPEALEPKVATPLASPSVKPGEGGSSAPTLQEGERYCKWRAVANALTAHATTTWPLNLAGDDLPPNLREAQMSFRNRDGRVFNTQPANGFAMRSLGPDLQMVYALSRNGPTYRVFIAIADLDGEIIDLPPIAPEEGGTRQITIPNRGVLSITLGEETPYMPDPIDEARARIQLNTELARLGGCPPPGARGG